MSVGGQWRPRPYLALFNPNTFVMDRQTDRLTNRQLCHFCLIILIAFCMPCKFCTPISRDFLSLKIVLS